MTNPQSIYGQSKCLGEEAIRSATPHHIILRTSWVFGVYGNNFLKTILRLAKERDSLSIVADQHGAPTSAALIADITAHILKHYAQVLACNFHYGTYHLCAGGETTWCDYARFVLQEAEKKSQRFTLAADAIQPIPTSAYPLPAPRPTNSRLDCSKLTQYFGLSLPHWQLGVAEVVAQL
jgi:dTDP-4-dehydrorhamnose reductase